MSAIEMHCGFAVHSLTVHQYLRGVLTLIEAGLQHNPLHGPELAFDAIWTRICAVLGLDLGLAAPENAPVGGMQPVTVPTGEEAATPSWAVLFADRATSSRAKLAYQVTATTLCSCSIRLITSHYNEVKREKGMLSVFEMLHLCLNPRNPLSGVVVTRNHVAAAHNGRVPSQPAALSQHFGEH